MQLHEYNIMSLLQIFRLFLLIVKIKVKSKAMVIHFYFSSSCLDLWFIMLAQQDTPTVTKIN